MLPDSTFSSDGRRCLRSMKNETRDDVVLSSVMPQTILDRFLNAPPLHGNALLPPRSQRPGTRSPFFVVDAHTLRCFPAAICVPPVEKSSRQYRTQFARTVQHCSPLHQRCPVHRRVPQPAKISPDVSSVRCHHLHRSHWRPSTSKTLWSRPK